jgi:hypothetical protein
VTVTSSWDTLVYARASVIKKTTMEIRNAAQAIAEADFILIAAGAGKNRPMASFFFLRSTNPMNIPNEYLHLRI